MKTYKLKSSAVRAAKKEMGENWAETAKIVEAGDEFTIELINPVASNIAAVQLLADQAQADKEKAEKKAEIESTRPKHIPKLPPSIIVAEESAPTPKPDLPAFLKIAPPAESEVAEFDPDSAEALAQADAMEFSPDFTKAGDTLANKIVTDVHGGVMQTKVCPDCGSEELYNGESINGLVQNQEYIIGCHHCAWHVDIRAGKVPRPRLSTTELPTKKVWHIADEMLAAAEKAGLPAPKRKDVIAECVRRGVAYGTSRTQYQHWFKCLNDSKATPIATIGKDGKISMPNK